MTEDNQLGQLPGSGDRHRVQLTFDQYGISARELIHPESGCRTADHCGECGRAFDDDESSPCYDCTPPIPERIKECWVTGWFENLGPEELFSGTVVLDVEPEFKADACTLNIVGASIPDAPSSPGGTIADPVGFMRQVDPAKAAEMQKRRDDIARASQRASSPENGSS